MSNVQVIEHPKMQQTGTAITPMDMLDRAVASGASVETLDKLMALQDRWERNEARKAFDRAIASAKAEIKPVVRNREGHNSKRYVDFAAIAREVDPVLTRFGLSYRFRTEQTDRINVTCILFGHGHSEESRLSGPPDTTGNKNAIQAIGSTLTYLQRYSLVQALGLAAADDDDGKASAAISEDQADKIRDLLTETKSNADAFLRYVGAESISDIPASKYADAIAKLEAKRGQK